MPVAEVQLQLQSTFCIEIAGLVPALILAKASRLTRTVCCPGLNTGQYVSLQVSFHEGFLRKRLHCNFFELLEQQAATCHVSRLASYQYADQYQYITTMVFNAFHLAVLICYYLETQFYCPEFHSESGSESVIFLTVPYRYPSNLSITFPKPP